MAIVQQEYKRTFIRDGGVGAESRLSIVLALEFGQHGAGNVETRDHVLLGELKADTLGVVVDILHLRYLERDEALIAAGKGRLSRDNGDLGGRAVHVVVAAAEDSSSSTDQDDGVRAAALGGRFGCIAASLLQNSIVG